MKTITNNFLSTTRALIAIMTFSTTVGFAQNSADTSSKISLESTIDYTQVQHKTVEING